MKKGDYVKIHGLVHKAVWNGLYAEVVDPPEVRVIPTVGGDVQDTWCGVFILGPQCFGQSGYIKPENLTTVATTGHEQRAVNIHLFGTEAAPKE
jgi:hypothetical protein